MAHTFAVSMGGKEARRLKIKDFLFKWGDGRKRQSAAEQMNIFRALAQKQESPRGNDR